MELFSRLRRTTESAQQSSNYGILPCVCYIIFGGLILTQQLSAWAETAFISSYLRAPWMGALRNLLSYGNHLTL